MLGTLLGDFLYMVAAVLGLAAVMQANPLWFEALQWFGGAYLCWMGLGLLRAKVATADVAPEVRKSARVYFRQAFAVSLTNPKVILFFVALFPLFLRADAPASTLVAMMGHVTTISLLYQALLVFAGNAIAARLTGMPWARRIAPRLAGFALIAFGAKLALANR